MIKLIATDVDGTLVKDSSPEVYPELFDVIKELRRRDIIIAIASGRQYYSIARMFEPVAHDLIFIAENGAHIKCRETDMSIVSMNPHDVREIIMELRKIPDADMVVSTPQGSLLESKNPEFIDLITNSYHNKVILVDDCLSGNPDIIKVALYRKGSIRDVGEGILIPKWKNRCKVCMAGEEWVDFMDASVDKGNALKTLQDFFHILPEETMVFGDNANDIGMLKTAGESYAVESARDEVKQYAKHICKAYTEKGVYQVLKKLADDPEGKGGDTHAEI